MNKSDKSELNLDIVRELERIKSKLARLETNVPLYTILNYDTNIRSVSAAQNDYAIGDFDIVHINTNGVGRNFSGFTGGTPGRLLIVTPISAGSQINFLHSSALSVSGNRILTSTAATISKTANQASIFYYGNVAAGTGFWFMAT